MSFRLNWHGPNIKRKARRAAVRAVNQTTAEAVKLARPPFPQAASQRVELVQTGKFKRSIRQVKAKQRGNKVTGAFGSFGLSYALFIEARFNPLRGAAARVFRKLKGRLDGAI